MKRLRFSPGMFTVAFCCAYSAIFALNSPLFLYYPLHGNFIWGAEGIKGAGPSMAWYGIMAKAAIVAVVAAISIPDRWADRVFRNYLWIVPVAAMGMCIFLLRRLFA